MKSIDTVKKMSIISKNSSEETDILFEKASSETKTKLNKINVLHSFIYIISIIAAVLGIVFNYFHLWGFVTMWVIFISSGLLIFISEQVYLSHYKPLLHRANDKENKGR